MSIKSNNKVLFKKEPKLYNSDSVTQLISLYDSKGGVVYTIDEGVLGYGTLVLSAPKCKCCVVQDVYLNAWDCAYKIRFYNKLPKKWEKAIDSISN